MVLCFRREVGTGRAKCKLCKMPIDAGMRVIKVYGYATVGQCHELKRDCNRATAKWAHIIKLDKVI